MLGIWNTYKEFFCVKIYFLFEGDIFKCDLEAFYKRVDCLLKKNISLIKHNWNSAQEYFSKDMINSKQIAEYLAYQHCFYAQSILSILLLSYRANRGKCNKWKEYVSLEDISNIKTDVVHINASKIKVICNFCRQS